ncbi:MAG: Gfo/Idh/MocA family protein, partial [Spirochaetota bacterium]
MKKLRLGIVGPGLIWERAHRPEVERHQDLFEVSAFSARSRPTADKVKAAYPRARFHYDYKDLVNDADVDAVVVLTPIPLNAPVASATLEAGKAAFLEKPIGVSVDEARALCELEERSGGRVYVLEQAPYGPEWDVMESLLRDGALGCPVAYETARHARLEAHSSGERDFGDTEWRIQPEYPLGVLFDGGVHELARQARLFGAPTHVQAVGRAYREGYGDFDHVAVILEY